MKMSVKKTVVFIAVVIVTCVVSAVMTCIVSGMLAENKEDKMLISWKAAAIRFREPTY